eukprot:TRINITY_DN2926_c0_g1_i1.p1 TRINITY_DN2926_c0_g1~~TRINITY_DN2926_c0_g1_i1.p1  ORF type:complete len:129 (-),score=16.41 TRINITY_DN2926_c0_g1_i1:29-415(-)
MSWMARLSNNMNEIKFTLCGTEKSHGANAFIEQYYARMKKFNPTLPITIRHYEDLQEPEMVARFDFNVSGRKQIANMTPEQIYNELQDLWELGDCTPKADMYAGQESYKIDTDIVDFDIHAPNQSNHY